MKSRDNATKYHQVKFFERRKLMRLENKVPGLNDGGKGEMVVKEGFDYVKVSASRERALTNSVFLQAPFCREPFVNVEQLSSSQSRVPLCSAYLYVQRTSLTNTPSLPATTPPPPCVPIARSFALLLSSLDFTRL